MFKLAEQGFISNNLESITSIRFLDLIDIECMILLKFTFDWETFLKYLGDMRWNYKKSMDHVLHARELLNAISRRILVLGKKINENQIERAINHLEIFDRQVTSQVFNEIERAKIFTYSRRRKEYLFTLLLKMATQNWRPLSLLPEDEAAY